MAFYLAIKEIWRNRGRFFLFSLVIALITVLVLFIAALAQGLAAANKEYLEKLDADLIVFQEKVELSTTASRIGASKLNDIRRTAGVVDAGPIGFASGSLVFADGQEPLDVSLIGVEPGRPGMPPVLDGKSFRSNRGYGVVIDSNTARQRNIEVGDRLEIKTIQGSEDEFNQVTVVGLTSGQQYFFQPSIFIPLDTWENIRPQGQSEISGQAERVVNVVAVKLADPEQQDAMASGLQTSVGGVEAVDRKTAYEATPGYAAQQSTLNTQQGFTLLIGILVIGGFFQIQTLQKVPQIGMLKAVGTPNISLAIAVILQIVLVTIVGVILGSTGSFLLSLALPTGIPFIFVGNNILIAIIALLLIGPVGGMVSVRLALSVEPLRALGM